MTGVPRRFSLQQATSPAFFSVSSWARTASRSFRTKIRPDVVTWSYPSSLTSIRGKDSLQDARGGVEAELFRKDCRGERKSKILSPCSARFRLCRLGNGHGNPMIHEQGFPPGIAS
jgi:hypothetical protein